MTYGLGVQTIYVLLIVGASLLLLETILPGMIAGAIGGVCLFAAVVMAYVDFGPRTGTNVLLGVMAGLVLGSLAWIKFFPGSRMAKAFISHRSIGDTGAEQPSLLNQTGAALTTLRPSGTALINGHRVDVVSEGGMIERGTAVKVVAVEGLRTVVRAVST